MSTPHILAFAGSLRAGSFNKKLVRCAASAAEAAGTKVTIINLDDYALPVFDEDLEKEGTPENATKLKALMREADGFLIASPEYNSSVSAALKNAIDWASRPAEGEPMLAAFAGKAAVLMAASPGALGGLRGLVHLKAILGNIQVTVLPQQFALSKAFEAFDDEGKLKDEKTAARVADLGSSLAAFLAKHVG
ncbi:NADPH-dependent FMN reductase [Algisphaera agarilytica]|uniref:NAD(P)H-dependent FMN reductase n=1 Tax=Algisphaera agarilytica TaxID=1385975 RepID=A0A7X0H6X3_9BACT|nr:NAD(P)H-dependent oxidoreductase [Algisphaera agarilytica]MBB6429246.1 NAD(P)H-dependent FMN reductase [Algisphaera agarilytica]